MKRCIICTKTSVYYGEYMIKNARDQGPGRNNQGPMFHCSSRVWHIFLFQAKSRCGNTFGDSLTGGPFCSYSVVLSVDRIGGPLSLQGPRREISPQANPCIFSHSKRGYPHVTPFVTMNRSGATESRMES